MSARKLILVKHSAPEIMPTLPPNRWRLSKEGKARCNVLADKLAEFEPEIIVSSVEPKAMETAQIVASRVNRSVVTIEELDEHQRGVATEWNEEEFQARIAELFRKPGELVYGMETADEAHARFRHAIDRVLKENVKGNVVVVSHGTVISLYVTRLARTDAFGFWKRLGLPSFVVLELPDCTLKKLVENVE